LIEKLRVTGFDEGANQFIETIRGNLHVEYY
jgi:hypothetical protein